MLEFKRRVLKFSLDDEEYTLNYPNVRQVDKFSSDYELSEDKIGTVIDFLDSLGFDKAVCETMEMDHVNQILEKLTDGKK